MHKQSIRLSLGLVAGAALVVALSVPAAAHHGWGGQDTQETTLTGTLAAPLSLSGPHGTMKINVNGQVYDVTLGPPARTANSGLREGVIPLGAEVSVRGHANKTANRYEIKGEYVTWNNRTFAVYPDRH